MKDQIMINSLTQTKITDYFSKNPKLSTDISNDDNNSIFSFFPTNENESVITFANGKNDHLFYKDDDNTNLLKEFAEYNK